jgi:hypothetical protein
MDRRRFLATFSATAALGLAGCPGDSGGTDTPGETADGGANDGGRTPTATPTDPPMPTATRSPADPATPSATPTDAPTPTATPTDAPTPTATPTPSGPVESDLPALRTDGKWVVDEDGNEVVLRGVATVEPGWGMDYPDQNGGNFWETLTHLTDESRGWYPGVVRVPCTIGGWENAGGPSAYAAEYLDRIVDHCAENGVYVMIDHHLVKEDESDETDRKMRRFWNDIAPRYADRSHVIYELYNEPTEPAYWDDDERAWSAWKDVAQPWVDLVQDHAPDRPLIIGSPRWTSLPHMAPEDPFEGDNLIYSGHIYPANGEPEGFDEIYGQPANEVPVMITEFGWSRTGEASVDLGTTSGWGDPFGEWLASYPNMGWQAWCFSGGWLPRLIDSEANVLGGDAYAGHTVKQWLYDRRNDRTPDELTTEGAAYEGPTDETPPPAPTGLNAFELSDEEYEVVWDATEDGETSTQFYRVYVNGSEQGITSAETFTITGTPGEDYEVTVAAVDALSNESERSDPASFSIGGELQVDAEIAQAASAPAIDASVDDVWSGVSQREFQHVVTGSVDGDEDLSGYWRGLWDADAFYLLVDVTDDAASTDSDAQYNDDSVEVFADANNSKGDSYDGVNDFQFSFPRGGGPIQGQHPRSIDAVEWAQTETDAGYRMEIAFPWSVFGVTGSAGHAMGFDVHVNDDDDGGSRDGKLAWFGEEDVAWNTPSALATVQLVE